MAEVEIIKPNLITEKINTQEKNLKKVCAYARVSTDSEEQLTSYTSQIKYYSSLIKANPEWKFIGIYADEGISGTQTKNRVEFRRMIDDAMNGKIDIILAKSISRFARNTLDTLKYCRMLRENKVDVFFEKENIHTANLDSEMFLTLYSAFAQAESESISQNVRLGFKAMMKRGEIVGKPYCLGYRWDKLTKKLSVYEPEAEIVRLIFNYYVDGLGTSRIAKKLNEQGYKTFSGKSFSAQGIREIILNEKYVGDLVSNKYYTLGPLNHKKIRNYGEREKYYTKNHHPAIISRELWDKCQEIFSTRSKKIIPEGQKHWSNHSNRYTFSSKVQCGICGTNYNRRVGNKKADGTRNVYWTCFHKTLAKDNCPKSLSVREDTLKELFVKAYNSLVDKKHGSKDMLIKTIKQLLLNDDTNTKLDKIKEELQVLQKRLSHLIDLKLDNFDNQDAYKEKEQELNKNIKDKKAELQKIEEYKNNNKSVVDQINTIDKIITENDGQLKTFDDSLFSRLVDRIIIGEKDDKGNINPYVIRIVLKVGKVYTETLIKNKGIGGMSFRQERGTFPTYISQLTIEYSGDEVVCSTTQINPDNSVYLAGCMVEGKSIDYEYGSDKTPTYRAYYKGDEVNYNDVDYYVIKDSGVKEEKIILLKKNPLTVAEVNQYGTGHINKYTNSSIGTA